MKTDYEKTTNINAKVPSLVKAMRILELFSVSRPELGVTEISAELGINKSSVYNILSTFQQLGYVQKCANEKYALGLKCLEYSFKINQHLGYPQAIYDIVLDVSNHTDMITYFGLPWGTDVLYLYVVHPISQIKDRPYKNITGEKAPLYCTGIGKAILSAIEEEEWPDHITKNRVAFTENTILDYDQIIEELKETKRRGYAIDNIEREPNVRCVAMPVWNNKNELIGGLSISGPASVITKGKEVEYAEILKNAVLKIKERLYH